MINDAIQIDKTKELAFIRLKRQYRAFIRLIRVGKFTTAMVSARILGVSRSTINEWLKTQQVLNAMNEEVENYVSKIKQAKDWKAQAYLLDKLDNDKDKEPNTIDLSQLIVVNVVPQEPNRILNLQEKRIEI